MTNYIVLAILAVTIGALIGAAWVCHDQPQCAFCGKKIKGRYTEVQMFGMVHDTFRCCPYCQQKLNDLFSDTDGDYDDDI